MERTALHYAMGVPSVEILTSILIKCGAKRIQKDIVSFLFLKIINKTILTSNNQLLYYFSEISSTVLLLHG